MLVTYLHALCGHARAQEQQVGGMSERNEQSDTSKLHKGSKGLQETLLTLETFSCDKEEMSMKISH